MLTKFILKKIGSNLSSRVVIEKFKNNLNMKIRDTTNNILEIKYIEWLKNQNNFPIYKDGTFF